MSTDIYDVETTIEVSGELLTVEAAVDIDEQGVFTMHDFDQNTLKIPAPAAMALCMNHIDTLYPQDKVKFYREVSKFREQFK